MLAYFALLVVLTAGVLVRANGRPHADASESDSAAPSPPARAPGPGAAPALTPQQATQAFPPAEIAKFRTIAQDTPHQGAGREPGGGHQTGEGPRIHLDADQRTLQPRNQAAWMLLDGGSTRS